MFWKHICRTPLGLSAVCLALAAPVDGARGADGGGSAASFLGWILGWDIGADAVLSEIVTAPGDVIVAGLDGGAPTALIEGRGCSWPVFDAAGARIYAACGASLVTVPAAGGDIRTIAEVPGLAAPLAATAEGEVLAVIDDGGEGRPVRISAKGEVSAITPAPDEWTKVLRSAFRPRRVYGPVAVEVDYDEASFRYGDPAANVFIVPRNGPRRQVTSCWPQSCTQADLDPAGGRVVFIRH